MQPGPTTGGRPRLPRGRAKRTSAIEPAHTGPRYPTEVAAGPDTTNDTRPRNPQGGGWVALPPRPPEIYRLMPISESQQIGASTETGRREASRLRSWPPRRRSGRVSASPYPPLGSLTSVAVGEMRNHSFCAPAAGSPLPATMLPGTNLLPAEDLLCSRNFRTYPKSNRQICARPAQSWSVASAPKAHFYDNWRPTWGYRHFSEWTVGGHCKTTNTTLRVSSPSQTELDLRGNRKK